MEKCNNGHREIFYDDKDTDNEGHYIRCPMCELLDVIKHCTQDIKGIIKVCKGD
jgi:hypothetical protein